MALASTYIFHMNSISIFLIILVVLFINHEVHSLEAEEPFIVPEQDLSKPDVCYNPYACFFKSDFFDPFFRQLAGLPHKPEDIDVEFLLFTETSPGSAFHQHYSDDIKKLRESHFSPKRPTIFIIHGWVTEFKTTLWSGETKNSFIRQYDVNVVGVNWKKGAAHNNYVQAVANSRLASLMIAKFIRELCEEYNYSPKDIWIIGHSIGAHIAGFVGKNFTTSEDRIGRITGLDPAGPFYRYDDPRKRLDKNDAIYLETISTDAASNGLAGCGTDMSLGQIEIYLNGGSKQPGCSMKEQHNVGKGWAEAASCACNHGRITEIIPERFEEFADKCQLVAYKCDNYKDFKAGKCSDCGPNNSKCALISLQLEPNRNAEHGKYYVDTSASSPFCVNHYAVSIDIKSNQKTIGGQIKVRLVFDDSSDGPEAVVSGGFIKSGEELSTLVTTELEPRPISYAEVYWDINAMGMVTNAVRRKKVESMMINKITVQAMSFMDPAKRAELSVVLCPGQEEIKSNEAIAFFPCE